MVLLEDFLVLKPTVSIPLLTGAGQNKKNKSLTNRSGEKHQS